MTAQTRVSLSLAAAIDEYLDTLARLLVFSPGKVFVSGVGTSGLVAACAAPLLSVSGTPAVFLYSADDLRSGSEAIGHDDVLIVLSKGGDSHEAISLIQVLQSRCIPVGALPSTHEASLADFADITVLIPLDPNIDPDGDVGKVRSLPAELPPLSIRDLSGTGA